MANKEMRTLTFEGTTYNVKDSGATRFDAAQALTDEQKAQARENIGAAAVGESGGSGGSVTVDAALSETSTNPVQNKVVTAELVKKAAKSGYTASKNVVTDADGNLATEDKPTALPNPSAITFTGAATVTYDGSEALTVNIPDGGSDFIINISDRGVADKTFEEAMEAYNAGKNVRFLLNNATLFDANVFSPDEVIVAFSYMGSAMAEADCTYQLLAICLMADSTVQIYSPQLALSENYYNKSEIDALFGTNLTEVASLIGGDA